ncbi:MAG: hypothetical protein AAF850_13535 [Pseudomonadota bacterium]
MTRMEQKISLAIDTSAATEAVSAAGREIDSIIRTEITPSIALIDAAFAAVGKSIETELGRAVRSGNFSLKRLASDLRHGLVDGIVRRPIQNFLTSALSAPFGGARAAGGGVAPNASYLVGERGPELFVPHAAGRVYPGAYGRSGGASAAPIVNITLPNVQDADSFRRSETQISAAIGRAVARGARNN